jgi:hypothetical protein
VVREVEKKNEQIYLMGKPLGKLALRRPRQRWEDNIKMDLRKIACRHGKSLMELVQDRVQRQASVLGV